MFYFKGIFFQEAKKWLTCCPGWRLLARRLFSGRKVIYSALKSILREPGMADVERFTDSPFYGAKYVEFSTSKGSTSHLNYSQDAYVE